MEGSYFQKAKTVQTTSSLVIVWAIDVDDVNYLWRMQEACRYIKEACRYIKEYGRYIKELVRNGGIILDFKKETRSPSPLSNYPFVVSLVLYFKNRRKLDNFNLRVSWYTSTSY